MIKIIGGTGHRKFGSSYNIENKIYSYIIANTKKILLTEQPNKVITGMAIGYDQILAKICIDLKIPFVAAIPFIGQELLWPKESQNIYRDLLDQATEVVTVSNGGFASWKMQRRNQWIVDNSSIMICAYDGSAGGTRNCVEYAKSKNKSLYFIDPKEA